MLCFLSSLHKFTSISSPPLILRNPQESLSPNVQGDAPKEARTRAPPKQRKRWEPGNLLHISTAKKQTQIYRTFCVSFYMSIQLESCSILLFIILSIMYHFTRKGILTLAVLTEEMGSYHFYKSFIKNMSGTFRSMWNVSTSNMYVCVWMLRAAFMMSQSWSLCVRSDPNLFAVYFSAVVNTKLQ